MALSEEEVEENLKEYIKRYYYFGFSKEWVEDRLCELNREVAGELGL